MDFEKKYPLTQLPGEFILVQWTRGYKEVELFYKEESIAHVQGAMKLKQGISVSTDLGVIKLKLSEKPVMLDVIVDGFHSPVNVSHPMKELKKTSTFFWLIAVFSFIAGALEVGICSDIPPLMLIVLVIDLIVFATYVLSAVFVSKGKSWAFYLGFSMFSLFTLLTLLILFSGAVGGIVQYMFMALRFGAAIVLIINLKTAISATKHLKYKAAISEDLLDNQM